MPFAADAQKRADTIRGQLEKAGVLKKDGSDYVKQIVEKMTGGGIPVALPMQQ